MKRANLRIVVMSLFLLVNAGFAAAQDKSFNGVIMDSQCAKSGSHKTMMSEHAIKTEKACTLGCVKNGGNFVLYDPMTHMTYQLDDQAKPVQYAGDKVMITGTYDSSTKTIHITEIQSGT